ncbi:MAG TPA: HD domain-containing phosphohydrolase [Fimbriiglobus sp.]|nr:HD domain-containing phosphohydrolase [Fimbriiglobus sp.]
MPSPDSRLAAALLHRLVSGGAISADAWADLTESDRQAVVGCAGLPALAEALLARRLVTPYQAGCVRAGAVNGLVLGNYRVLEKVGTGGMGVVFRAEHRKLRTPVAVKALVADGGKTPAGAERFFREVRAVASLRHPNVVAAIDAGEEPGAGPDGQPVPYLVMEYVPGRNLDDLVAADGPLSVPRACQLAHQIADALTEAHRHGLVHRDIKPSNVIVTPDGQAKLLDFGVARLPAAEDRLTQEGTRLGTVGYMAPEQARDPAGVDARADVFGLAATLFFALTGQDPFRPPGGSATAARPPRLADFRADAPPDLGAALDRMMALDRAERTPGAAAAMRELAPFLGWQTEGEKWRGIKTRGGEEERGRSGEEEAARSFSSSPLLPLSSSTKRHRVLIVDDEEPVRRICRLALAHEPVACDESQTGPDAAEQALAQPYDLILLDVDLPGLNGEVVLRRLRRHPPAAHTKVVMLSGRAPGDDLARLLAAGADDFLTKPFSVVQLRARVKAALRLKDAHDRSDLLTRQLAASNAELEQALTARDGELIHARGALVLALAKLVEQRSSETGAHLIRLQRYCRVLAEAAAATPAFAGRLDPAVVQAVEAAAPLHDIGKVAVPDHVLNKPGPLTADERALMQAHTSIGADTLAEVSARYAFATAFFHTAIEIARHHHERWDGAGYPDRLAGEAIPLSARLVAVADVYDALRSRRAYKPAMSHPQAVEQMLERSAGHFDPALLGVFRQAAGPFDRIYRETAD